MSLEEAIANAEQQAIRDEKEAERIRKYGGKFYDDEVQACLICAEQHRQLAEWLKELIERRKQPEIIYCKDCEWYKTHSSWNCKKYYYCARESITATVKTENDFCSKAEKRADGK